MKYDTDLTQRLQSKKHKDKAFSELIDTYQERLYWHVRKLVITHQNTDDVLQNTFVRVYKSISNFKGNSALHTWLYRVAYNESLRFLEKENKRKAQSLDDDYFSHKNHLLEDAFFDGDEAKLKLHEAIASLTEKQQRVFQMKYFDDLSFRDISEILNISESTLKSSYYTAEKLIKEQLTQIKL